MYIWKVLNAVQSESNTNLHAQLDAPSFAYGGSYAPDIAQAVSHYKMQPQLSYKRTNAQTCYTVQEQTIMYCIYTEHNATAEGIPPPHLPHTIIHVHLSQ